MLFKHTTILVVRRYEGVELHLPSAIMAEKFKKNTKRPGEPNGRTMEQRVRAIGKTFYPLGSRSLGPPPHRASNL